MSQSTSKKDAERMIDSSSSWRIIRLPDFHSVSYHLLPILQPLGCSIFAHPVHTSPPHMTSSAAANEMLILPPTMTPCNRPHVCLAINTVQVSMHIPSPTASTQWGGRRGHVNTRITPCKCTLAEIRSKKKKDTDPIRWPKDMSLHCRLIF